MRNTRIELHRRYIFKVVSVAHVEDTKQDTSDSFGGNYLSDLYYMNCGSNAVVERGEAVRSQRSLTSQCGPL